MNRRARHSLYLLWVVTGWCLGGGAALGQLYPEGERFDDAVFRNGLKRRGLTDLLSLHLLEHRPSDDTEAALLARDIKLTESADPSRSPAERHAALHDANRLLESLIDGSPEHRKVRAWQMELAESMLYTEAARFTSSILYRGGTAADGEALAALMDRTVAVLERLHAALVQESNALDDLSARQYERLEQDGVIEKLESDLPKSEYMLAWARLYRAMVRPADDPQRAIELGHVIEYLVNRSGLLITPHGETHFQVQALLLAGMSFRLLGDHPSARTSLGRTIDVASGILDDAERRDLQWAVTLARIELVRSFRDGGDYDAAVKALKLFREEVERSSPDEFGQALVVGLLERSVHRAEADRMEDLGRSAEGRRLRGEAVRYLTDLAARNVAYRDEIYATLYDLLGPQVDAGRLAPFEQCALLAGLLGEAGSLEDRMDTLLDEGVGETDPALVDLQERRARVLDRAIEIATPMVSGDRPIPAGLDAEVSFNLAVALHQRGRRLDAARAFLGMAKEHPRFFRAQESATYAVQLAWELRRDPSLAARPEVQNLYLEALSVLTDSYGESASARYWQFFLAQHLAGMDRLEAAAEAYARIDPQHERYHEARYLEAEARGTLLKRLAAADPEQIDQISRLSRPALRTARQSLDELNRALQSAGDPARKAGLKGLAARATVLIGELYVVPGVNRWAKALETLESFEHDFPGEPHLLGRVLRVRMIALELGGRHDESTQLIPQYIASDPEGAPATLQGLFESLGEEIERDKQAGRIERARARAASAEVIAQGLYDLVRRERGAFGSQAIYALRLQLAEAALEAEDFDRAGRLFDECLEEDAARYADGAARDSRALYGRAESSHRLGRYEEALPLFVRIFRAAAPGDALRWQALLRDLQCRTALKHDARSIIKAIHHHRFLDSEMGGADLRREFDLLLAANEQRVQQ